MFNKLISYFDKYELFYEHQYGFRSKQKSPINKIVILCYGVPQGYILGHLLYLIYMYVNYIYVATYG